MSDQTALSFATRSAPADGVAVVFAGEGPKLTQAAQDLDKKSKGLLAKAAEITGFKGKKDQLVDLIAPQGLKFARVVLAGIDKTASFGQEDWLNLGGSVRGTSHREGGADRPRLPRERRRQGDRRRRCKFCARRTAARLQVQKVQDQGEEEKRRRRRNKRPYTEEDRRPLRRPQSGEPGLRGGARDFRRRDARARSRQRARQRARARRVCRARQGAHQVRRAGRGARAQGFAEARHERAACRRAGERRAKPRGGHAVARRRSERRRADRTGRQGRHLRHWRHLAEASRRHGRHEGRHGRARPAWSG